jgi:hypothetical protein
MKDYIESRLAALASTRPQSGRAPRASGPNCKVMLWDANPTCQQYKEHYTTSPGPTIYHLSLQQSLPQSCTISCTDEEARQAGMRVYLACACVPRWARNALFRGVPGSGSGVLRGGFRGVPGLFRVHQSPSKQPLPNTPTPSPTSYQPPRHGVRLHVLRFKYISAWICDGAMAAASVRSARIDVALPALAMGEGKLQSRSVLAARSDMARG